MVWTDPGVAIPPELIRVLDARGLPPIHADSPHTALSELCLAERVGVRVALIISGPADPARLVAAAERFAPSGVIWIFQPGANPPLRPFVLSVRARPAAARPAPVQQTARPVETAAKSGDLPADRTPRNGSASPIRLVRENGLKPDSPQADPIRKDRPISARDILDDAELEMLLAGERAMEDEPR